MHTEDEEFRKSVIESLCKIKTDCHAASIFAFFALLFSSGALFYAIAREIIR